MRVFLLVMMILGGFFGAGFASGKEIVTYFCAFGGASYWGIATCVIVFFLLLLFFFWLSQKVGGLDGLIQEYFCGYRKFIKILFAICILILVSAMFAGAGSVGETLGINKWIAIGLTAIVIFVCNYFGLKGISGLNAIIVPMMMGVMLVVMCKSFGYASMEWRIMPLFSGTTYAFINMLMLGLFLLEVGKNYTKKECVLASIWSTGIICVLLVICNFGLLSIANLGLDMPMLYLAKLCGGGLYVSSVIAIWLAILTTLFSNVYVLDTFFGGVVSHKGFRLAFIILLSIIVSQLGFDIMVRYMYLFIGVVGVILVLVVGLKERKQKTKLE